MASSVITGFDIPEKVYVGKYFDVKAVGVLTGPWSANNFAVSVVYHDGPADKVTMKTLENKEFEVGRGEAISTVVIPPPSTPVVHRIAIKVPKPGKYKFRAITGSVNGAFYVDCFEEREVLALGVPFDITYIVPVVGVGLGAGLGYLFGDVKGAVAGALVGGGLGAGAVATYKFIQEYQESEKD